MTSNPDRTNGVSPLNDDAVNTAALLDDEEQMSVLAGHIRLGMRNAALKIDPTLAPFGLKLLRLLAKSGPTPSSEVAEALFVDRSAVSRQVRQLEELGLIELHVDPEDGRARFLKLTPLAETKLAQVRQTDEVLIHKRLSTWPTPDLQQFAGYIARLNSAEPG